MTPMRRAALGWVACSVVIGCDAQFDLVPVPEPAAMAPLCLEDAFDGPEVDASIWIVLGASSGIAASIDAQALRIGVPEATASSQDPYRGVKSATMNLTGGSAEVQLQQPPPSTQPSLAGLTIGPDQRNYYNLFVQTKQLVARTLIDGTRSDVVEPYDPVRHQFLRIRHDRASDEVVFESRGDNTEWALVFREARAFSLELADVTLFASSFDIAPAFSSVFDNVAAYAMCQP